MLDGFFIFVFLVLLVFIGDVEVIFVCFWFFCFVDMSGGDWFFLFFVKDNLFKK